MKKLITAAAVMAGLVVAPTAALAGRQDFHIVNHTGHTVVTLQVSSSANSNWGPDILGVDTLANNAAVMVHFAHGETDCLWDIRVTYDDGDTSDMRQQNLCELSEIELTAGD